MNKNDINDRYAKELEENTMEENNIDHITTNTIIEEQVENNIEDAKENEKSVHLVKEIFSWVKIFVIAFIVAAVIDNFIIINANVPSGSMENTIMTGDRMIGNRLSYIKSNPERGDVIIFKFPDNEKEDFVKRVIGLPGDKVTIKGAKIYINDSEEPLEESYLPEEWTVKNDGMEYNVPQDCYFVLGDNRNSSNDARYWNNTFVKKEQIIAKAVFVYWPFSDAGAIH